MIDHHWIKQKLASKSLKKKDLAEHLGWAPSQVTYLLAGERNIQIHEIPKILEFLGEQPSWVQKSSMHSVAIELAKGDLRKTMTPEDYADLFVRLVEYLEKNPDQADMLKTLIDFQTDRKK